MLKQAASASFLLLICACIMCVQLACTQSGQPEEQALRIAVASNFVQPMQALVAAFQEQRNSASAKIQVIGGSTGKQYAQIKHGAPFDLFFAADAERPQLLEQDGLTITDSRRVYAIGHLVLWGPSMQNDADAMDLLSADTFQHLAIANPKLAPYGRAAQEVLVSMQQWEQLQPRLVRGENIAQCYQFVASGNAQLGFVAASQLVDEVRNEQMSGFFWPVPAEMHSPIKQECVLLRDSAPARAFMQFMQSDIARGIIRDHGYTVP